jgi:hypothetical protein
MSEGIEAGAIEKEIAGAVGSIRGCSRASSNTESYEQVFLDSALVR